MTDLDDVLTFIRNRVDPVQIPDVADEFGLTIPAALGLLNELEERGLIVQVHRGDGRGALLWEATR